MKTIRVIYEGRVQGVGFRYTVKEIARGFDVCGTIRNLPDGTVELFASGDAEELAGFLHEIREESAMASKIRNHYEEAIDPPQEFRGFLIEK